jgi:hypothetical protein
VWNSHKQACIDIGIDPSQVDWLVAAYPGDPPYAGPVIYPGSIGHQWIDRGSYDESVVLDGWQPGRRTSVAKGGTEMIMHTPTGDGYWLCKPDGSIWSHGDAQYLGGTNAASWTPMPPSLTIVDCTPHPTKQGYWLEANDGSVFAFGASQWMGNLT